MYVGKFKNWSQIWQIESHFPFFRSVLPIHVAHSPNIVPSQLVKVFPLHLPIFYPPNFSYTVAYITDCYHCTHNRWCHYHTSYSIVTWDNRLKCCALWYNWEWSLTPCNCYWPCSSILMSLTGWLTSLCHIRSSAWCIGPVCPLGFLCPSWFMC